MYITQIITLLTGIALFLFGMSLMGDGLKSISGDKLEPVLFRLSGTPFKGILLGTGVTAVIQSSCATSVMVVGFVNSRMMKLRQAVYVILGSILGTSITGWILCLSYLDSSASIGKILSTSTLVGIVSAVGIYFRSFGKKQMHQHLGDILMGFAVLMVGMESMSSAVGSLGEQPGITNFLLSMNLPALGILVGAIFTAILQSASAAVGIIQALSVTGGITFSGALPLLMGVTIGASFPVLLSALGAKRDGRRTAFIYLVASTIGVMAVASVYYILDAIFQFSFMSVVMNPVLIALLNTILRLAILILLIPLTDMIEAITGLIVPAGEGAADEVSVRLEERFIGHPALAIKQSRITINDMAEISKDCLASAFHLLTDYSEKGFEGVQGLEAKVDRYEDALGSYLVKLTGHELSEQQNRDISCFLHTLSDFERISDHALNIAESAKELNDKKLVLSDQAWRELSVAVAAVREVVRLTVDSFVNGNLADASKVEPLEEVIDELCDELKLHHVERLQKGLCTIRQGFVFNDLITSLERCSDHCSNIAAAMLSLEAGAYDPHEYLEHIRDKQTAEYKECFDAYRAQYSVA